MKVILAGYNVDAEVLEEIKKSCPARKDITPETISASYARISRDPRPVTELRRAARAEVEEARKSNRAIIFKMGHHSVAEHAVLNFDILGISRLAIETLEAQRLCSYTEKSQRYIKLEEDFVIPYELNNFEAECRELFHEQHEVYEKFYSILKPYFLESKSHVSIANEILIAEEEQSGKKIPDEKTRKNKLEQILDGWAKEDARYVLSLATLGQLGFTSNARDLEKFIKYCTVHPLREVQELGKMIYEAAMPIIPSLLLFFEPNDYMKNTRARLKKSVEEFIGNNRASSELFSGKDVTLLYPDKEADTKLIAALMSSVTNEPFMKSYTRAHNMSFEEKKELLMSMLENMQQWDGVPREFEIPDLSYEIYMSASCFAQFKRHRMLTLLPGEYNVSFGYTIPQSIIDTGLKPSFVEIMKKTDKLHLKIKEHEPAAATYVLTNAHNRRILVKLNARELYHVSRFREDLHAQWDIRDKAAKMVVLAKEIMPLTMMLIGGKHKFQKIYDSVFAAWGGKN
jgi:thymidylate synthase ThyX